MLTASPIAKSSYLSTFRCWLEAREKEKASRKDLGERSRRRAHSHIIRILEAVDQALGGHLDADGGTFPELAGECPADE